MFNTSLLNDSPRSRSKTSHNEMLNGSISNLAQSRNVLFPLQQTRRDSPMVTPTRPSSVSSRRYSLSDINSSTPLFDRTRNNLNNTSFLSPSSNRYEANLSAYVDTRSPGYAGRMVQYNKEQEKSLATHQKKYGSPGVLPIVHLFKKKLEPLKKRPSPVTVRIASPDISRLNSPEHNRMLLERIVQTNSNNSNISSNSFRSSASGDISTRSVLDALREISRKRIHAHEEDYELSEDNGKRIRLENLNNTNETINDCKKRQRDESTTLLDRSVIVNNNSNSSKKMCFLNELIASQTSMKPIEETTSKVKVKKSKSLENEILSPETKKLKVVVDVETQTVTPNVTNTATDPEPQMTPEQNKNIEMFEEKKNVTPILKVFDDKPLETIRKKRLAILMGTFTENDCNTAEKAAIVPVVTDTTDSKISTPSTSQDNQLNVVVTTTTTTTAAATTPEKPLISILSGPNKTPNKSVKHVTFNLSNVTDDSSLTNDNLNTVTNGAQINFPIVSQSPSLPLSVEKINKTNLENTQTLKSNTGSTSKEDSIKITPTPNLTHSPSMNNFQFTPPKLPQTNTTDEKTKLNLFNFNSPKSESPKTSNNFLIKSTTSAIICTTSLTGFKFTSPTISSTSGTSTVTTSSGSNPIFAIVTTTSIELPKSLSTVTITTTAVSPPKIGGFKFDLNKPVVKTTSSNIAASVIAPRSSTNSGNTGFSFGTSQPQEKLNFTFTQTPTQSLVSSTTSTSTGFFNQTPTTSTTSLFTGFGTTNSSVINNSSSTKALTSTVPIANPSTTTNSMSLFTNNQTNVVTTPNFGVSTKTITPFTITSSIPSFGTTTTTNTNSIFPIGGVKTTTSMFNFTSNTNPATTTSNLNFNTTTTASMFNTNKLSDKNNLFTAVNLTPATTNSGFVSLPSSSSSSFGSTTSITTFGINSTPTFATTSTTGFGGGTTPFGTGSATTFGTGSSTNFGTSNTPTTTVGFGTSNVGTGFTVPKATSTTTSSMFGANNVLTTTPAATFGSVVTTASSTTSVFGTGTGSNSFNPTAKPLFGGSSIVSPFSTSAIVTTTTASSFSSSNLFPITTNPSSNFNTSKFGVVTTTASSFGSTHSAPPSFGSSNSFGAHTGFGGGGGGSGGFNTTAFGTPATTTTTAAVASFPVVSAIAVGASNFGSNSNAFGSNNNNNTTNFGTNSPFQSTNNQQTPAFGASATNPSNVNFNANSSNNIFGSSSTFGGPALPQPAAAAATAPPPTANSGQGFGFSKLPSINSFGANSSTTNFGNNNPTNTFGTNQQNNFSTNPIVPSPSGVFTFGSPPSNNNNTNNNKPSGVFSFGSNEVAKPNFNFTAGASNFGSNAGAATIAAVAPSFSTPINPTFGTVTPNFNSQPATAPGMFSIGTGSASSSRSRTQKFKRRT